MDNELEKIEAYIEEVGRTWEKNPEFVLSRQFFEFWEGAQKPEPFKLTDSSFEFLDVQIPVPDKQTIALLCWDFSEEAPCLKLESPGIEARYPIMINEGIAELGEPSISELDDTSIGFGERLEFILDIISKVRELHPSRNVQEMQKSEYNEAHHLVSDKYEERTAKLMSRLRLPEIRKLIDKAVQDMALDELSDQLVLPLDGNYAAGAQPESGVLEASQAFAVHPSHPRTQYEISRDLRFLRTAGLALSKLEQEMILSFENCEVISGENPAVVRVMLKEEMPVRKGENLMLFKRGTDAPIGKFKVEINDRMTVVGQVRWPDEPETLTDQYYARSGRTPTKYMAQLMEAFAAEFENRGHFNSAALNAAMGVEDFVFEDSQLPDEAADLDLSQKRAWANAVNPNNSLSLIQGPPGTGKTHVLEKVLRELAGQGRRILVVAPSHTAVDNVVRRIMDLPVLRIGRDREKVAPDVAEQCWIGDISCVQKFQGKRDGTAAIFAGTHLGIIRDEIVLTDQKRNGPFDTIIFDEAGMARMDEFCMCCQMAHRAILFGDHQQLPPFPLPESVLKTVRQHQCVLREQEAMIIQSPLQWLAEERKIPVFVLQASYRCQNPRLMRFSSTLFYNAQVKASAFAEYYQLPYDERQSRYPSSTLTLYSTSTLPLCIRGEHLIVESGQPGFENPCEAKLAAKLLYKNLANYPIHEITIIVPYRRQVQLLRETLDLETVQAAVGKEISEKEWNTFLQTRISTVDSFQGGESDLVIISYVRSSAAGSIGFVDDPNRINVAHTRCRKEMIIIGDLTCLKRRGRKRIFHRMERAIDRDGEVILVTENMLND